MSVEAASSGTRAGEVIRGEVASIVEAAGASAARTERDALSRREGMLAAAREVTARLHESITTAADELDDLRSVATREADTLRSLLAHGGRAALGGGASTVHRLQAPPVEASPHLGESATGDPTPPEPHSVEAVDAEVAERPAPAFDEEAFEELFADAEVVGPATEAAEPEPSSVWGEAEAAEAEPEPPVVWPEPEAAEAEPEQPAVWPEPESEAAEAEPEQPAVWPEPEPEPESEQPPVWVGAEPEQSPVWGEPEPEPEAEVEVVEPEPEPPSVWGEPEAAEAEPEQPPVWGKDGQAEQSLEEQGRRRVTESSDEGLAESYMRAVESYALAVDRGDVEDAKLWEALRRAAIEEARARPEFGRSEPDASLSRRQRRLRDRQLRKLIKARDEAAPTPPDAAAPPDA